jgi:hypothetical protein
MSRVRVPSLTPSRNTEGSGHHHDDQALDFLRPGVGVFLDEHAFSLLSIYPMIDDPRYAPALSE